MTVSKRDIQVLIGFIGVAIAALVYFFVYRPNMDQMKKLNIQNDSLSGRVTELEAYQANLETYEDEIYTKSIEIDEKIAQFPADVRPEDVVQEAILMEDYSDGDIYNITYNAPEQLYNPSSDSTDSVIMAAESKEREHYPEADYYGESEDLNFFMRLFSNTNEIDWDAIADGVVVSEGDGEEAPEESAEAEAPAEEGEAAPAESGETTEGGIYLMCEPVDYALTYDVSQMKRAVSYLVENSNRTVIDTIVLSYDSSTGLLAGDMQVRKYYMSGTNKTYEAPSFDGVSTGTDNLFSTVTVRN